MTSRTLKQLLAPPSAANSEERALEFINSQFRSLAQLEQKEPLQRIVKETQDKAEEHRAAFQRSHAVVQECIKNALSSTRSHLAAAQELSLARHGLADELSSLSSDLVHSMSGQENENPTLLEGLETLHRSLKGLEGVRSYISVIERALRLSEAAVTQAQSALSSTEVFSLPPTFLTQYQSLRSLVSSVASHCSTVENPRSSQFHATVSHDEAQPLNIVKYLTKVCDLTWSKIKEQLASKLLQTAEDMGWPQPIEYNSVSSHTRIRFESEFLNLIKLQDLGNEIHVSEPHWNQEGIYPIQVLTSPIILRFKFHFEGKRETNRMDKPEWYFTHILNVAHVHRLFLDTTIQALLSTTQHRHINAFREFTFHLLTPIIRKLWHTIPRLLQHPSLLAHTIYQTLAFDASLSEQGFSLQGTTAKVELDPNDNDGKGKAWKGVCEQVLGKKEWFEAWLEGERKFAEDQYIEIISSSDAWQMAEDLDEPDASNPDTGYRPTNSARRVKALIEQITDRYRPLPRFAARSRFLITIQIPIIESYHSRISSSLDAFETLSSSFVRAVPGTLTGPVGHSPDTRRLTSGVEGVGRLVKAGLSAHYIAAKMDQWGEDIFFLELWSEINARATLRANAEAHPSLPDLTPGSPSMQQGDERASKGTIFQELVTQYRSLAERAEDMIVKQVCAEVESASKAYFSSQWEDDGGAAPDHKSASISSTLGTPISLFSSHLVFLAQSLPGSSITTLYRSIGSTLATLILQRRLLRRGIRRISLAEAQQIAEECLLWVQTCRVTVGRSVRRVEGPWIRLLDALKLLTLDQDKFHVTVGRIFDTQTDGADNLCEELDVADWELGDLIDLVRLRQDCWR